MNSSIRKFIFRDLRTIEGYIDPPDALVFLTLLQKQKIDKLEGGIAEIGVFYGRSYFLFKKICGENARILAIDLFDIDQTVDDTQPQYRRFIDNGRRLNLPVDEDLIIKGDSTRLKPQEITDKVGNVLFFSIDGGHMLSHVVSDSRLAMRTLAGCGVIAFDDTFNPAWPEVTVAVADFLRENSGTFCAFCMTKYKTYVCRREFHEFYLKTITESPHLLAFDHVDTEFLGSNVTRLDVPTNRRILYELIVRSGMSGFAGWIY
jgi:hypothetical protein